MEGSFGRCLLIELELFSDKICKDEPLFDVPSEDLLKLKVFDRKGQEKFIVDTAVYTRNRHFRLLGSTKLNKNAPLAVSKVNKYIFASPQSLKSQRDNGEWLTIKRLAFC